MPAELLKIITNGFVLTCDPENRAGQYTLLVRNGRIAEISDSADVFTYLHPYAEVVDATGRLIVPGFVNAHFHGESVLLRERTQGLHFSQWPHDIRFREAAQKLLEHSSMDDLRSLYLATYFGHLKSGTTCVGEFGPPVDGDGLATMLDAIARTEVRSVITLQNWSQITKAVELDTGPQRFALSLGRPQDFTVYTFESVGRASKEMKIPLLAHIAEQREEVEEVRKNFQKNVVPLLHDFNALQHDTQVVHLNHLTEKEVEVLADLSLTATICARSAAFKQTGYPALRHLASHNVRLAIGTDWSNLDMLKEIQFLSELQLLLPGIKAFKPVELVRMTTINGAQALGMEAEIGSIETGKRADLTFFDIADVRIPQPNARSTSEELAALLINDLSSKHISDVMINGEFFVRLGQIMTMSEEDVAGAFQRTCESFFPDRAVSDLHRATSEYGSKPRLVSFIFEGKPPQRAVAGFEEGHAVQDIVPEPAQEQVAKSAAAASTKPAPSPNKPELSKDVRRVFGEDDDF